MKWILYVLCAVSVCIAVYFWRLSTVPIATIYTSPPPETSESSGTRISQHARQTLTTVSQRIQDAEQQQPEIDIPTAALTLPTHSDGELARLEKRIARFKELTHEK
ncbi:MULTISPECIES: hypothetical protein [Aliagarivorans]|uniref:hypothetical protein n=1 Tax=Aliagarivorans TaxID=882379 RepID=UPI00047BC93B|nr:MULTISPECIES: hypothetical protein [Aliagarivorans]